MYKLQSELNGVWKKRRLGAAPKKLRPRRCGLN
jgi:hypothetical protein